MMSLKLYAKPGWSLRLYDSEDCHRDQGWGVVRYLGNSATAPLAIPYLGEEMTSSEGSYEIRRQSLAGKVSAIYVTDGTQSPSRRLVWWEGDQFEQEEFEELVFLSDAGRCRPVRLNDEMRSFKFKAPPRWVVQVFDSPDCDKDNDDWASARVPGGSNEVQVPILGDDELIVEATVTPPSSYDLRYDNGLSGKVSAIKFLAPRQDIP
jgi:hypothetical protein